jgi:hypothetical protein
VLIGTSSVLIAWPQAVRSPCALLTCLGG